MVPKIVLGCGYIWLCVHAGECLEGGGGGIISVGIEK